MTMTYPLRRALLSPFSSASMRLAIAAAASLMVATAAPPAWADALSPEEQVAAQTEGQAAPATAPKEIDPQLKATLDAAELNFQTIPNGDAVVPVRLSADSDRVLPVFVTSNTAQFAGRTYRAMFAAAVSQQGPIDPGFADQALTQNLSLMHGAWCLRTDPSGRSTLLFKVPVPTEMEPAQFRELLRSVASVAVRQRAQWLGEDLSAVTGPSEPPAAASATAEPAPPE
ncbi:MAG: hypothetical protein AAF612_12265 [Planctomycetota bacterium]